MHTNYMFRYVCLLALVFSCSASGNAVFPIVVDTSDYTRFNDSTLAESEILTTPFPYVFPQIGNPTDLFPMLTCNGVRLEEATIDELQKAMRQGLLTTTQIVLCYLQRIYQTDSYIEYDFQFIVPREHLYLTT